MLQDKVGVLSEPEHGDNMRALETTFRRVAYCKTRAASSRLELVIIP